MMIQKDTYYRGYRLSEQPNGEVMVYSDADFLSGEPNLIEAKKVVDNWVEAR